MNTIRLMTFFALSVGSAQLALAQEPVTVGPNGEPATPVSELALSDAEVAQIQASGQGWQVPLNQDPPQTMLDALD